MPLQGSPLHSASPMRSGDLGTDSQRYQFRNSIFSAHLVIIGLQGIESHNSQSQEADL